MASDSSTASFLATATDLAGRSWAVWAENGLLYAAHWDAQANRWSDAAAISNATGGRNVQLSVGQVVRRSDIGQDLPALVVTWESGPDNDADVYAAVGFYRNDGSVLWSDAVNLLPGGVAETNHSVGLSGNRLVLATEAQAISDPISSGPKESDPGAYQDSEINTYSIAIQSRSSDPGKGNELFLQRFSGGSFSGALRSLITAPGLTGGQLIGATVNGVPLTLGSTTTIPGLGSFTLSADGQLNFQRGSNPVSELLFSGELIGSGPGGDRAYQRTSALLRPTELILPAQTSYGNDGYTLSVSTLNGSGSVLATSTVPLSFNASERRERVTAATFAPPRPLSDGSSLRDFTGSGRFADASLARAAAAANGSTSLENTALLSDGDSGPDLNAVLLDRFRNPYVLQKGLVSRYGVSFSDVLNGFALGSQGRSLPLLNVASSGYDFGLDGLLYYNSRGEVGSQFLDLEATLNLRLGRTIGFGDRSAVSKQALLGINNAADFNRLNNSRFNTAKGPFKNAANNWIAGNTSWARKLYGPSRSREVALRKQAISKQASGLLDAGDQDNPSNNKTFNTTRLKSLLARRDSDQDGGGLLRASSGRLSSEKGNRSQQQSQLIRNTGGNRITTESKQPSSPSPSTKSQKANFLRGNTANYDDNSSNSLSIRSDLTDSPGYSQFEQYIFQQGYKNKLQTPDGDQASTGFVRGGQIRAGYLFGIFPLRAIDLTFAARESYRYSTSQAIGLSDPTLTAKRFQVGLGVDVGLAGSIAFGFGQQAEQVNNLNTGLPLFNLLDVQGEIGLRGALSLNLGFSEPKQPLAASLIWKDRNYNQAYLPIYENSPSGVQWLFKVGYYTALGLSAGAGPASAGFASRLSKITVSTAGESRYLSTAEKLGRLSTFTRAVGTAQGIAQVIGQVPYLVTAGQVIFTNLGSSSWANTAEFGGIGVNVTAYANASVGLFNGAIQFVSRNSAGLNFVIPNGINAQYDLQGGLSLGGIYQSLYSLRGSTDLAGDTSTFIANVRLAGGSDLSAGLYRYAAGAADGRGERLTAPDARVSTTGGQVLLAPLLSAAAPLTGDTVLSLYAVVQAPEQGAVDADGFLRDFRLRFDAGLTPLRVALDQRALRSGPGRLSLAQPWLSLLDQWGGAGGASSTAPLVGVRPGQAIPLQIDLRLPAGSTATSLAPLNLAYQLDGAAAQPFGSAAAPLLDLMPGSPVPRQESGSNLLLGENASGTIGAGVSRVDPYVSALVVANTGRGYSDTDFILEEGPAVVRGRLLTDVTSGAVLSVDIYRTASSPAFAGPAYESLDATRLQARLSGGSDARVQFSASGGRLTDVRLALAADGKTQLAGSDYLAGGSGSFLQWLNGNASTGSARALLRFEVRDGRIADVGLVRQEGSFADQQAESLALANSVAGDGSGLLLRPLTRSSVDANRLDETGIAIGSFQRYVDAGYRSEVLLSYTQGGPDRTAPINGSLNLDTPLVVNRFQDGRGWVNLAFQDPPGSYTPGVDGYNFDSASNSLYFNNDAIGGKRDLLLFSHADLRAIQSERDLYLLDEALLQSQLYVALERKDPANNLFFAQPVLLSDPSQGGSNTNGVLAPFYAVQGAGVAPIFDANRQVLAAWVHTAPSGQAEIQVRIGSASGTPDNGSVSWGAIRSIALPDKVSGNDVTELSLTYLDGRIPVLSWSLNSLTPYQAAVLRGDPTAYYRLDDLPSQGSLASIGASTLATGQIADPSTLWRYSSWLDTSADPLSQAPLVSGQGALQPQQPERDRPGDPNAGLTFGGGSFAEVANLYLDRLNKASNEQPSGYAADVWIKADPSDPVASIIDNGLYNPAAILPGSNDLKLPVTLRREATTELVDGVERKGYRYSLVVAANSFANLGTDGVGSGLSPFNLSFAAAPTSLSFSSATAGSRTITLQGTDLGAVAQYTTRQGKLDSFTLGDQEVLLSSFFEADAASPGLTKTPEVVTYNPLQIGIETQQIQGWSLRKRVVGNQQILDFNYGTNATLSAALPSADWTHVAVSYGEDVQLATKVARLMINGQVAAEAIEDPNNLKGYNFNTLPYQIGYSFKGSLDELVLNDQPISNPAEFLRGRQATRFVNPRSATNATFFSNGVYDVKSGDWSWQPAGPFNKADFIPSTLPAAVRGGPVDMATAGSTAELRGDGRQDLRAALSLNGIAVGSLLTGLRVRLSNGEEYGIGDGLRYGMDGKSVAGRTQGLICVLASNTRLNSGSGGREVNFALMGSGADLDLYLPASESLLGSAASVIAFVRSPQNRAEGGDRFSTWPFADPLATTTPVARVQLERSNSAVALSPKTASVLISSEVQRQISRSLLDVNSGFNASLAETNEPTLADPNAQVFAEAIAAGSFSGTPYVAIANPSLDGVAGSGNGRGVVWAVRFDLDPAASGDTRATAAKLQALRSLVSNPQGKLSANRLDGFVVVGRDGQQLGSSLVWADLDGDRNDELVLASRSASSPGGVANSGELIVISGAWLKAIASSGSRVIQLSDDSLYNDTSRVRVFRGADASEFGAALAFGKVLASSDGLSSYALLIGAPGYSTAVSTDPFGNSIPEASRKQAAVGAVFQLAADANLFKGSSAAPQLLISGDLPGLANFNGGDTPTPRRFGEAISLTTASGGRDFDGNNIADIAIGIPGLVQSRRLKGGINARASAALRDGLLEQRQTLPAEYREGIDATELGDPIDVQMGGVLLLQGGASAATAKKVLVLGDTVFGDAAGAGAALASGGDFDRGSTQIDDLAIGSPLVDGRSGAVSLLSGATIRNWFSTATASNYSEAAFQRSAFVDAALIVSNDQESGLYGRTLALNGDVNGDSYSDLVIGDNSYGEGTGRVNVLFGDSEFGGVSRSQSKAGTTLLQRLDLDDANRRLDIYPSSFQEGLGGSVLVSPVKGTRNEGRPVADLLLPSSNGSSTLTTLYGKPRLKGLGSLSSRDLASSAGLEIDGLVRRPGTSASYGLLGDVNGDGLADALVDLDSTPGRPRFKLSFGVGRGLGPDHQDSGTGGSSTLDLLGLLSIQQIDASDFSLQNVQAIGDLNSDGVQDLLIRYRYTRGGRTGERSAVLAGGDLLTSNVLLQSAVLEPLQTPQGNGANLPSDALLAGQALRPGEYLVSPNGRYVAVMQTDGNFVVQGLRSDGRSWDVSFALSNLTNRFYQSINIGAPAGSPLIGSTPGTRLEIQGGKLMFINEQWQQAYGGTRFEMSSGFYKRGDQYYEVSVSALPPGSAFQELRLGDDGALLGRASDGSTLFRFEPAYSTDLFNGPIPQPKLLEINPLVEAPLQPLATAALQAAGGAPSLLAIAQLGDQTQLRWIEDQELVADVAALYRQWFAAFSPPASQEQRDQLGTFNAELLTRLLPFDARAIDAAEVTTANLDDLAGFLDSIAAGAGASFRNYVASQAPRLRQTPVQVLRAYGDAPNLNGGSLPVQGRDVLLAGQRMVAGSYLRSANGRYIAVMQSDGNFVVQTLRNDGTTPEVSFSLNDLRDSNGQAIAANVGDFSVKLGSTAGTSLEIRNGRLCFVNDRFRAADGSNAIAVSSGSYLRFGQSRSVSVTPLAPGARFQELRLGDDGVLVATASDGSTLFRFEPSYSTSIISGPIPAERLSGLQPVLGYEALDLRGRRFSLVDRNGDGYKELLISPGADASDRILYSVALMGKDAANGNQWLATTLTSGGETSGSFLWASNGDKPANELPADQRGDVSIRKINGYTERPVLIGDSITYVPDKPVETGGAYGINGASLSRDMLYLGGVHASNSFGQYSRQIGGADLKQRLQQRGESWEVKVAAYVWQMKSKGDGTPSGEGGDELVLHLGSGQGIRARVGDTGSNSIGLDGLTLSFNEYKQSLRLFWNGQLLWQAGQGAGDADLARLLTSDGKRITLAELKNFMAPDSGLYNNAGLDTGPELMSKLGTWFANLFSSGFYLRYQQGAFSDASGSYQGRLILEVANAMRYLPFEKTGAFSSDIPRLNALNKGLQLSIPIKDTIRLDGSDVTLNAYGWSGAAQGLHALEGVAFNTDKVLEGTQLDRLTPVGDLNGDGYEELVGLGSLAAGWNVDYKLDLPNNNLTQRGSGSSTSEENTFTLTKGANGEGITRSTLISPVIVWGSASGDVNLDALTPIVRGSSARYRPSGTPGSASDPGLASLDNFTAAANVRYTPLGDVNADGFDDLGIADAGDGGSAYILYGGTGLREARSYLERFGAFFPETRAKDGTNLPIKVQESPDVYLTSNPQGFGIDANGQSTAWINAINLERSASATSNSDPAFGGVRVSKITGIPGQQLADLSGGGDFSGDGLNDLFLTSQAPFNANVDLSLQAPSRYVMFGGDDTRSTTHLGTSNSDSLRGTPANDVILSLAGNDIVQGLGGLDAISTGPGDDQIYLPDDQFRRIDGGADRDTLILQGQRNQAWDFTKLASAGRLQGLESLDLTNYGANSITLNAAAVMAMTSGLGKLTVDGDLQTDRPAEQAVKLIRQRLDAQDPASAESRSLLDVANRFINANFGLADLSTLPGAVRDVQLDLIFDALRSFSGDNSGRPLDALLKRLDAIEPADRSLGLGADFLRSFSQSLAFTPASALAAYEAWLADLPRSAPTVYSGLGAALKAALAALPASWKSQYASYFADDASSIPAALAFERELNASGDSLSPAEAYRRWLAGAGRSRYQLPALEDSRQQELLRQLDTLEPLAPSVVRELFATVDNVRLSAEFAMVGGDQPAGSTGYAVYSALGGAAQLFIPDSVAVQIDPSVPTRLIPTPATVSSTLGTTAPGTSLEAEFQPGTNPDIALSSAASSRDDLRISVSESQRSEDGRSLVFTLSRSGYLDETTRVLVNTEGYVNDLVPSLQAQVVFDPGVVSQELRIPLMAALPQEDSSLNPYDQPLSSEVSVRLSLLPAGSRGPRRTSTLALNALNAYTPELGDPSRELAPALLEPERLFAQDIALQLPTALWITALARDDQPIRFGLDNPQGQPLNDIRLLDRLSGALSSLFSAAAAGEAVIYGDSALSASTDLYFSVDDGGRYDQDGQVNGQITLAATGASTSPGTLLLGEHVLRAPSSSGLSLLFSSRSGGLQRQALQGYGELLFLPTDDTRAGLRQADGTVLTPADGPAYLEALSQRLDAASPFAAAVARVSLAGADAGLLDPLGNAQALKLLNDTNYIPVLSRGPVGATPTAADLALPSLRPLSEGNRAAATYALNLGDQGLIVSLSSPYLVVPGLEGSTTPLSLQFRRPSGSPAEAWQVGLLRVDDPGSDLAALLAGDSLADRLTPIPSDGSVNLLAGDLVLPLLFRGIDPATWAARPAAQRALTDSAGAWSVEIADPGLDPTPLLRRTGANSYRIGRDGVLVLNLSDRAQDSLGSGPLVRTDAQANRLERNDDAKGLTFLNNVIVTGDGADTVSPPDAKGDGDNILFCGGGRDAALPLPGDVIFAGSDADRIEIPADRQAAGARIDAGRGDDQSLLRGGGVRWIGGDGDDAFLSEGGRASISLVSGGLGSDRFWLLPADGTLPAAPLVIVDFSPEQGDRLVLPGYASRDLNFQQLPQGVQINLGNTALALLIHRKIEQVNRSDWFVAPEPSAPDSRLVERMPIDPAESQASGDGTLTVAELISDGVKGLAAHARKALGSQDPELRVYIHTAEGRISIGGGRMGQQGITTVAISEAQQQWMREQLASVASVLDLNLRFVADRSLSNLDIYLDSDITVSSERSTLGITLVNDNGRQAWTELLLNHAKLANDPEGFAYTFRHELLHVLGGEHPFDNSDGDSEGQAFGAPDGNETLLSYTRPADGWPDSYRWLDWAALVSQWGLNMANASGWRFRNASGEEVVLSTAEALQRLSQPQDGASFLGRADGLRLLPELPAGSTTPGSAPGAGEPSDKGVSETGGGSTSAGGQADNGAAPTGVETPQPSTPLVIETPRGSDPDGPAQVTWQSDWKQLDLELGAILDTGDQLRLLTPADLGLEPRGSLMLPGVRVLGSRQADVVFAAAANRVDLDAGEDTLFSLAAGGGDNRLFGGEQADHFYLAAAGDRAFGGSSVEGSDESRTDGDRNRFLIDLDSRPDSWRDPAAAITIGDFQVGLDSLTLIDPDPSRSQPLPISAATYLTWRDRLASESNIVLNAAPQRRLDRRGLILSAADLSQGLTIDASQFFVDPDSGDNGAPGNGGQPLRFVDVDVDASLPWLQLVDGLLRIAPGTTVAAGSYNLRVAASDGLSRTEVSTLRLAVDPTVAIGSLEIPAAASLRLLFQGLGEQARELLVQQLDANGNPSGDPLPIGGQVGQASGTPEGFDSGSSVVLAGDALSGGRLAFSLRQAGDEQPPRPLAITNTGPTTFRLEGAGVSIDAEVLRDAASAAAISSLSLEGGEQVLGLDLPDLLRPASEGLRQFELRGTLFREAAFNSRVGFYLADRRTGSVVDGLTGALLSDAPVDANGNPSADYLGTAAAHAVWQGEVADGEQQSVTARFQLDSRLDPSQLVLLPFLMVDDPAGRRLYGGGVFSNPDASGHVAQLGSRTLGFEDLFGGGDHDHDDLIFQLDALTPI